MENAQVAEILDEVADLLELSEGDLFRIRAYRGAAQTVRSLPQRLEDMVQEDAKLSDLPHIGKSTAEKIVEILRTGVCGRLLELRRKVPPGLATLMKVPQFGPSRAKLVYEKLGIDSIDKLKAACEKHKLRDIRSLGEKTEENILHGLETLGAAKDRLLLKAASDHVEALGRHLDKIEAVKRWVVAGSYRRRLETIGDLDVLIQAEDRAAAAAQILKYPAISQVLARGEERVTVQLAGALQVDFRFFDPPSFGAALIYFTGSKAHNVALRKIAQKQQWKLNEYGLFKGSRSIAGANEEEVFKKLGLQWIPPELREDRGEIAPAKENKLPKLIEASEIRGDLHCHTKATDGANTIEELIKAGKRRSYEYLAITDHSKAVSIAKGLDDAALRKHVEKIRKCSESTKDLLLLAGVEVDILKDGRLDLKEKTLRDLDIVIASIHSHFSLSKREMTQRLLAAVKSGVVHCIGHPLGRIIGRREPIAADWGKIFDACREYNVWLEINSQPDRMDLPDNYCKEAKEAGIGFVISTDAHKEADLDWISFGVGVARRGWLERDEVLNTFSASKLRQALKRN